MFLRLHPLEFRIIEKIARLLQNLSLDKGSHTLNLVVLASGGHDSTCLLWALMRLKNAAAGALSEKWKQKCGELSLRIFALHCNHKTRGDENSLEQQFVTDLCLGWGIPFRSVLRGEWDEGENFQEQAREWRLAEASGWGATLGGTSVVCTGHHARDVVETVLLNLIRGTGAQGLTCLPEHQPGQGIFRPFVDVGYQELKGYSERFRLAWKEDSSNASTDYSRNLIRQAVIPVFERLNPSYETAVLEMQKNLRRSVKPS
jgi:tRNA(Ile)-lysidine synthetase-like protein